MTNQKLWTKCSHMRYDVFIDSISEKLDDHQLAYLRQLEEAVDFFVEFGDSDPKALGEEIDRLSEMVDDRDEEIDQMELIQTGLEDELAYFRNKIDDLTDTIAELQEELNETKDN